MGGRVCLVYAVWALQLIEGKRAVYIYTGAKKRKKKEGKKKKKVEEERGINSGAALN